MERADYALGDRLAVTEGIADGDDVLTYLELFRASEGDDFDGVQGLFLNVLSGDLDDCKIV